MEGLPVQQVAIGSANVDRGNALPLGQIPEGTLVYNIEKIPGDGGRFVRAAGTQAVIVELGANDALRGIDPAITRAALADIVKRLKARGIAGIAGVDTRALTVRIRDGGPPNGVLAFPSDGRFDLAMLRAQAEAGDVEQGRKLLVGNARVDVLERHDVAQVLGGAVVVVLHGRQDCRMPWRLAIGR